MKREPRSAKILPWQVFFKLKGELPAGEKDLLFDNLELIAANLRKILHAEVSVLALSGNPPSVATPIREKVDLQNAAD